MQKRLRGSKRAILKKVTAVNLFADQATQIQAIMEAIGAQEVAPVVRLLLDEALGARRRKSVRPEGSELPPPIQEVTDLATMQTLLLKLIGQGETSFRIQSVSLELLQEVLVDARAGKVSLWEFLFTPALRDKGRSVGEIARLCDAQNNQAKRFAYGLAQEIKRELDSAASDSNGNTADDEDRQGSFAYDTSDIQEAALSTHN
ncbi:MAG: hypothetical protein ACREBG_18510 [Pyrinomonadaceae bacterium]